MRHPVLLCVDILLEHISDYRNFKFNTVLDCQKLGRSDYILKWQLCLLFPLCVCSFLVCTWSSLEPSDLVQVCTKTEAVHTGKIMLLWSIEVMIIFLPIFTICTFWIHVHCVLQDTYYNYFIVLVVFTCQMS